MKTDLEWETTITKCPHCRENINIRHKSTISERNLIQMLFFDIKGHIKNCNKYKKPKKCRIDIEVISTMNESFSSKLTKIKESKVIF